MSSVVSDRPRLNAGATPGMVRVDSMAFFAFTESLWAEARSAGRDYLTWDEWNDWARAAIKYRLAIASDFEMEPHVPRHVGDLVKKTGKDIAINAGALRGMFLNTWRRVAEAQVLGKTAEQFHRDEQVALRVEAENMRRREEADARARSTAATVAARARKYSGAAGSL